MKKLVLIVLAAGVMLCGGTLLAQDYLGMPFMDSGRPVAERVEDLLERLTLEEKVGLMMNRSHAVERLGIPEYEWWNEALHGVARAGLATVFPQAIGLAAAFDRQEHYRTFCMISDEARAKYNQAQREGNRNRYYGLTFWTPNINIFRDPRWGRGMETYGEDPYLSAVLGVAAVKGLQGDDPNYYKTHACAKHYAVHSGPEWNRHSYDAYATPRDLWETYLPVFESLVREGEVQEFMCAYNRFEGEPCCSSDKLLIQILREKWGYEGIVVSDCGAIDDFYRQARHETHSTAAAASADALLTGTDLECGNSYRALNKALEESLITETQLDVSLGRLLKARFELGMFDPADKVPWSQIPYNIVASPLHAEQALLMARKSMTLLKNSNNVLPLGKDIDCIAVIGPNANDTTMQWANYNGVPAATVTVLQGIQGKVPATRIIYDEGCDIAGPAEEDGVIQPRLKERLQEASVIIYAGGLSPRLEGEEMPVKVAGFRGGDREIIELPASQRQMLSELKDLGKPVIFVLCTGSAIGLAEDEQHYDALLNAWYPGQAGGQAVADVLFGDYNPAGRLPVTFYKSTDQLPDFQDYSMKGRTYRYMEDPVLYPFGHGLSYTTFSYGKARISARIIKAGDPVTVSFEVRNTGKREGEEVLQVYVQRLRDPQAPVKSLRGFSRIALAPGEESLQSFVLEAGAFSFYDPAQDRVVPKAGDYRILYGPSSEDSRLESLVLKIIE